MNSPPITLPQTSIASTWALLQPNDLNQHSTSQVVTSPSSSRNRVVTPTDQPVVNLVTIHSPIQQAVNTVVTNLPSQSRVVTAKLRVMVQQPQVTIPPSRVTLPQLTTMVVQQPLPSMWIHQVQNPSNVPFQSTVGSIQRPLVDVNQPPIGGQYTL